MTDTLLWYILKKKFIQSLSDFQIYNFSQEVIMEKF